MVRCESREGTVIKEGYMARLERRGGTVAEEERESDRIGMVR